MWKVGEYVRIYYQKGQYLISWQPKPLCRIIQVTGRDRLCVCSDRNTYYLQKENGSSMSIIKASDLSPGDTVTVAPARPDLFQNLPVGALCRAVGR